MSDAYLTIQDLQSKYKVGRGTVDKWRKDGLPFTKINRTIRFEKAEVVQWIKEHNSATKSR